MFNGNLGVNSPSLTGNLVPGAWIVTNTHNTNPSDRGRKSIKGGKVYLKDKQNFEIELFNPLTVTILCKISLNGTRISNSGLVLKPGERIYLDRFIDENKKFVFSTYEVENTTESKTAIELNGLLVVDFYHEEAYVDNNIFVNPYPYQYPNPNLTPIQPFIQPYKYPSEFWYTSNNVNLDYNKYIAGILDTHLNTYCSDFSDNFSDTTNKTNITTLSSTKIPTGRIEKGDKSEQTFEYVNKTFNAFISSSITLQLLPIEAKPIEAKDLQKPITNIWENFEFVEDDVILEDLKKQSDELSKKTKGLLKMEITVNKNNYKINIVCEKLNYSNMFFDIKKYTGYDSDCNYEIFISDMFNIVTNGIKITKYNTFKSNIIETLAKILNLPEINSAILNLYKRATSK